MKTTLRRANICMILLSMLISVYAIAQNSEWHLKPGKLAFTYHSVRLSNASKRKLDSMRAIMEANPGFKVEIIGSRGNSYLEQQLSWERVKAVIDYMSKIKNIDRQRFIFNYMGEGMNIDTLIYRLPFPGEYGPCEVPPPHPSSFHFRGEMPKK